MSLEFLPQFKPLFGVFRYIVLLSGRGSAKSTHIAIYLIWVASRSKVLVLCLREFMVSIADSSKAQLEYVIKQSGTESSWYITKTEIRHLVTGSRFVFKGIAHNTASIKSFAKADIAWVEECENITSESLEILIPTIREEGSRLIFSGNVKDRMQAVAQKFVENDPPESTVIISNSYLDNPLISKTLLKEAEHMKASNYALYRHIWLGEYLESGNLIICRNVVRGKHIHAASDKVVVGIDIARDGGDKTVICVRKGKIIAHMSEYATMDLPTLIHEVQGVIARWKPERINVDSTGHGAWVPDALRSYGIDVRAVCFAESAGDDRKYSNRRTELYGLAADYFEAGGMLRENDNDLERELIASYYVLDNKSRMKMVPKTEIKAKIGCSPDKADAFVLSLLCDGDMFRSTKAHDSIQSSMLSRDLYMAGSF